jgi:hypothetical protein
MATTTRTATPVPVDELTQLNPLVTGGGAAGAMPLLWSILRWTFAAQREQVQQGEALYERRLAGLSRDFEEYRTHADARLARAEAQLEACRHESNLLLAEVSGLRVLVDDLRRRDGYAPDA